MVFRAVSIGLAATLSAGLTFAQPVTGMLDGTKASAKADAGTPTGSPLSPENRGDILMARKMYREAVETFGEGPPGDPVLRNKTGIAYHQLMQLDSVPLQDKAAIPPHQAFCATGQVGHVQLGNDSQRTAIAAKPTPVPSATQAKRCCARY